MKKMPLFILVLFLFSGCGGGFPRGKLSIGVDKNWYPLNFGEQVSYVNGFVDELLLEISQYSGMDIEKVPANWDTLFLGLKEKKYETILTSLPPYEYNEARYDFSDNFLDLGPVLIVSFSALENDLVQMGGKMVGIITNDPAVLLLEKNPSIIIREYDSIPELLNAILSGEIDGALLNQIPAVTFIQDLYAEKLKIVGKPMTDAGLRMIAPKGNNHLVEKFEHSLKNLSRQGKVNALLQKWRLAI